MVTQRSSHYVGIRNEQNQQSICQNEEAVLEPGSVKSSQFFARGDTQYAQSQKVQVVPETWRKFH